MQINQINFQDLGVMQALFRKVFGAGLTAEMLAWKYGEGRGRSYGAFAPDGTLLAHCGLFYRNVLAEDRQCSIGQLGDLMALPGRHGGLARSKSPFALLIQQVLADLPEETNPDGLAFGFPSDRAMRLGEHLGLFASIDRIVQLTFTPLSRVLPINRCSGVSLEESEVQQIANRLWGDMAKRLGCDLVGVRDAAYLLQRYARHPVNRYDIHLVRTRWLGRSLGILVTRTQGSSCELLDIIASPDVVPELLETALQQMKGWGVESLFLWLTERHSHLVKALATKSEQMEFRIMANPFSSGGNFRRFADRWWLTGGDTDYR